MRGPSALFVLLAFFLPVSGAETILVIPFFNISNNKNYDWVGDSIAETIQESITSEGVLTVRQETRDQVLKETGVKRYARLTRASVMEVAVNLDAGIVVYGEVQFSLAPQGAVQRGRVIVTARMLNVRQLRRGPEFAETGEIDDLSRIQTRLAWRVLREVRPESATTEAQFVQHHPPVRIDALESYVRGLLAPAPEQQLKYFEQSARLEPAFTRPLFQLGKLYFARKEYRAAADRLQRVTTADSSYREAQFYLGVSRYFQSDYRGAISALAPLAAAAPLAEVENNLGAARLRAGQPDAFAHFTKAVELDPSDPDYRFNAGYACWRLGDFQNARTYFQTALERTPDDETARELLSRASQATAYRPGDPTAENLARVKLTYDESAWLHLKAMFGDKQKPQ